MEYVSGGELFELISRKGKLTEIEARNYFQQLITGVEYCHHNLVAHRDLKLENILIDCNGVLKVADFGLSNFMKDGKFLKTSCGSLKYAAPEVLRGREYIGTQIDVWSCGVIQFTMITGQLPFDDDVMSRLIKKITEAKFSIPKYVSSTAADLLRRMLTVNPMSRIDVYEIKRHPWFTTDKIDQYLEKQFSNAHNHSMYRINPQYIETVSKCNFNFHNFDNNGIVEAIALKKEYSFVIAYELLVDERRKKQGFTTDVTNYVFDTLHSQIEERRDEMKTIYMDNIENHNTENSWVYGFRANHKITTLIDAIYQAMIILDITFQIKSPSYKLKCFYKIKRFKSLHEKENPEEADDDKQDSE